MNLWTLVLGVACVGVAIGTPAAANDGTVTLSATGAEGVRVRGRCVLDASDGEREVRLDEAVPFRRRWEDAAGLRCELEASGPARVEAASGGSRSRAATSGGRLVVTLG